MVSFLYVLMLIARRVYELSVDAFMVFLIGRAYEKQDLHLDDSVDGDDDDGV